MERRNLSVNVAVVLLVLCGLLASKTAGMVYERDYNGIASELCELLSEYPSLPRDLIHAYSQGQNNRLKRKGFAGLENLDLLSGIFSKLPMRTSAGITDMQALMREVGRRRK